MPLETILEFSYFRILCVFIHVNNKYSEFRLLAFCLFLFFCALCLPPPPLWFDATIFPKRNSHMRYHRNKRENNFLWLFFPNARVWKRNERMSVWSEPHHWRQPKLIKQKIWSNMNFKAENTSKNCSIEITRWINMYGNHAISKWCIYDIRISNNISTNDWLSK